MRPQRDLNPSKITKNLGFFRSNVAESGSFRCSLDTGGQTDFRGADRPYLRPAAHRCSIPLGGDNPAVQAPDRIMGYPDRGPAEQKHNDRYARYIQHVTAIRQLESRGNEIDGVGKPRHQHGKPAIET
jgi:hypothetical protein